MKIIQIKTQSCSARNLPVNSTCQVNIRRPCLVGICRLCRTELLEWRHLYVEQSNTDIGATAHSIPTVASLCAQADQRLFATVTHNNAYPLQQLLFPQMEKYYSTTARPHNYQTPQEDYFDY